MHSFNKPWANFAHTIYEQTSGNKLSNNCVSLLEHDFTFRLIFSMRTWFKFDCYNLNDIELEPVLWCDCGKERNEISFFQAIKSTHKHEMRFLLLQFGPLFYRYPFLSQHFFYLPPLFGLRIHNFCVWHKMS